MKINDYVKSKEVTFKEVKARWTQKKINLKWINLSKS